MKTISRLIIAAFLFIAAALPSNASQGTGCLPTSGTVSGLTLVQDINAAIAALISTNSGASAPATDCSAVSIAGQVWYNPSTGKISVYDGTTWLVLGQIGSTQHIWIPVWGGGLDGLTAAGTTDLGSSPVTYLSITGTTTITSFGTTAVSGTLKILVFQNSLTITRNVTSLKVPGTNNIVTQPGDTAIALALGSGNWQLITYTPASGTALQNPSMPVCSKLDYMGFAANVPSGFTPGNGQPLSRVAFPDYFNCSTLVQNGTTSNGSLVITGLSSTGEFGSGMPVEGTGIPLGSIISSVNSSTQITLNAGHAATASGTVSIRVFAYGYGAGGDTTTVGVPLCQGLKVTGRDSSAGNISNFSALNTVVGNQAHTLQLTELPGGINSNGAGVSVSVSGTSNQNDVLRLVSPSTLGGSFNQTGGFGIGFLSAVPTVSAITMTSTGTTSSINVASNNTGGLSHSILDPTLSSNCEMKVLP